MKKFPFIIPLLLILFASVGAEQPQLISRSALFSSPDKTGIKLSPDGKQVAYIALSGGVRNIWIREIGKSESRVLTTETAGGVHDFQWSWNSSYIFYLHDRTGTGNRHIFAISLEPGHGQAVDMTPVPGVDAQFVASREETPTKLLIGLNPDNPGIYDLYSLDFVNGKLKPELKNPGNLVDWVVDDQLNVRTATAMKTDGGGAIITKNTSTGDWQSFLGFKADETAQVLAVGPDGDTVYVQHNLLTDVTSLYELSLTQSRKTRTVFTPREAADIRSVLLDRKTGRPLAVSVNHQRAEWYILDETVRPDFSQLRTVCPGDLAVIGRDLTDSIWLVSFHRDDGPKRYYTYDRKSKNATFLFTDHEQLDRLNLAIMQSFVITSRDQKDLVVYLTLPQGVAPKNLPLVLLPHGGPWTRDFWGFDPYHQWLANRGYAVLSVNYRGSTGLGKSFLDAGNGQWAGKIVDDLADTVNWAVKEGYADPARLAVMGASFGGYATLMSLVNYPETFRCGIDIVGYVDVMSVANSIPREWEPLRRIFKLRVADWESDPETIRMISPATRADEIQRPLLIAQGGKDIKVLTADASRLADNLAARQIEVDFLLFPEEGHEFMAMPGRLALFARIELFLQKHLGGRCEPPSPQEQKILDAIVRQ